MSDLIIPEDEVGKMLIIMVEEIGIKKLLKCYDRFSDENLEIMRYINKKFSFGGID